VSLVNKVTGIGTETIRKTINIGRCVKDCSGVQSSGCATDNEQRGRDLAAKRGLGSKVSRTLEKESLRQKSSGV
jgi:hypothetical protein